MDSNRGLQALIVSSFRHAMNKSKWYYFLLAIFMVVREMVIRQPRDGNGSDQLWNEVCGNYKQKAIGNT